MNTVQEQECGHVISDNDVKGNYAIPQIAKTFVNSQCLEHEIEQYSQILIKDSNDEYMTDIMIKHFYKCNVKSFKKDTTGKVAFHKFFELLEKHRNKKIASSIHAKELLTYKKNEVQQIQLSAMWDGIIAWRKLGYNYCDDSINTLIMSKWYKYMDDIFVSMSEDEYINILTDYMYIEDIPSKYLIPVSGLKSFSKWLQDDDTLVKVEMYKDVI